MKSLQQQVQSMNMRPLASAAAAVYPVVQPPTIPMPIQAAARGQVRPGTVVPMVPYGAMIPYAHYHAMMMPAAASAATGDDAGADNLCRSREAALYLHGAAAEA